MMFLNILQNLRENTCVGTSFLMKLQGLYRTPPVAASGILSKSKLKLVSTIFYQIFIFFPFLFFIFQMIAL